MPDYQLPYSYTGRRLGRAVMGLVLGVIGMITLTPFDFRWPRAVHLTWGAYSLFATAFDVVANVALFLPLGFLYALTRAADDRPTPPRAVILRALLLAMAASVQSGTSR